MANDSEVIDVPDCLTDDKAVFAARRVAETALGGMRLSLPTKPPAYVIIFQLAVFLLPAIMGVVVCFVVDSLLVAGLIAGGALALLVLILQIVATVAISKGDTNDVPGLSDLLDLTADGDFEFDGFWHENTWKFFVPEKSWGQTGLRMLAAVMMSFGMTALVHPASQLGGAGALAIIWGWLVVALAAFSLTCTPPPEMARWGVTTEGPSTSIAAFNRPFAVIMLTSCATLVALWREVDGGAASAATLDLWQASDMLVGEAALSTLLHVLAVITYALPLLWLAGAIPPVQAMVEVLLELGLAELVGTSPAYSTSRLVLHLVVDALVVLVVYVIGSSAGVAMAVAICLAATLVLDRTLLAEAWETYCQGRRGKFWLSSSSNKIPRVAPMVGDGANDGQRAAGSRLNNTHMASQSHDSVPVSSAQVSGSGRIRVRANAPPASIARPKAEPRPESAEPVTLKIRVVDGDRPRGSGCLQGLGVADVLLLLILAAAGVVVAVTMSECTAGSPTAAACDLADPVFFGIVGVLVLRWLVSVIQRPFFCGLLRNKLWDHDELRQHPDITKAPARHDLAVRQVEGYAHRLFSLLLMAGLGVWAVAVLPSDTTSTAASLIWTAIAARRFAQRALLSPGSAAFEVCFVHLLSMGSTYGVIASGDGWTSLPLWSRLVVVGLVVRRVPDFVFKVQYVATHIRTAVTHKKLRFKKAKLVLILSIVLSPLLLAVILISTIFMSPLIPLLGLPIFLPAFPRPRRQWKQVSKSMSASTTDAALYQQMVPQLAAALEALLQRGALGSPRVGECLLVRLETLVAAVQVLEIGRGRTVVSIRGLEQQQPTSCHHVEAGVVDSVMNQINKTEGSLKGSNKFFGHTLVPAAVVPVRSYSASKMALVGMLDNPDVLKCIDGAFYRCLVLLLGRYIGTHYSDVPVDWTNSPLPDMDKVVARERYPTWFTHRCRAGEAAPSSAPTSHARAPSAGGDQEDQDVMELESVQTGPNSRPVSESGSRGQGAGEGYGASAEYAAEGSRLPRRSTDANSDVAAALASALHSEGEPDDLDALLADVLDEPEEAPAPRYSRPAPRREERAQPHRHVERDEQPAAAPAKRFSGVGRSQPAREEYKYADSKRDAMRTLAEDCYAIVQVAGLGCCEGDAVAAGPGHVCSVFNGEVPTSLGSQWLMDRPSLLRVCLQAYRIAVKQALNAAVMMGADEFNNDTEDAFEEFMEEFKEIQSTVYLGSDTDRHWVDAIVREKPQLFSLVASQGEYGGKEYSGHLLSLHDQVAYVAWMNPEAMAAIWASLSQELLFFTNDDDERYSIQAHKTLLRNLSVQLAQPPLGYPVWNSGPLHLRCAAV